MLGEQAGPDAGRIAGGDPGAGDLAVIRLAGAVGPPCAKPHEGCSFEPPPGTPTGHALGRGRRIPVTDGRRDIERDPFASHGHDHSIPRPSANALLSGHGHLPLGFDREPAVRKEHQGEAWPVGVRADRPHDLPAPLDRDQLSRHPDVVAGHLAGGPLGFARRRREDPAPDDCLPARFPIPAVAGGQPANRWVSAAGGRPLGRRPAG